MGVVTNGALNICARVRFVFWNGATIMAVKTESSCFRNQQSWILGGVWIVTNKTTSGGKRTVDIFFVQFKFMAIETELFFGGHKFVGHGAIVASFTLFGGIRRVFGIVGPDARSN